MRSFDVLALRGRHAGIGCSRRAAQRKADPTDDQRDEEQPTPDPGCNEDGSDPHRYEEAGEKECCTHEPIDCHSFAEPNL
jgi:hypothetical protein